MHDPLQSSLQERNREKNNNASKQRIREHVIRLLTRYEDRILDTLREEYNLSDDEAEDYLAEAEEEFLQ